MILATTAPKRRSTFSRYLSKIERTPNVKHGSITAPSIAEQLAAIGEKKNVCFVAYFGNLEGLEMDVREVDVLWIVGTQAVGPGALWHRTHIAFWNSIILVN